MADIVSKLAEALLAFPQRRLAGGDRRLGALALGNVLGHDIDADHPPIRALQRVPAGAPDMVGIALVGALPMHLDADDGLSLHDHRADDLFDRIGELRNGLTHRAADVVGDRNAANLGQTLVDLRVATIEGQECQSDRSGIVNELKIRGERIHVRAAQAWLRRLPGGAGRRLTGGRRWAFWFAWSSHHAALGNTT
jgi:hypothetical protein